MSRLVLLPRLLLCLCGVASQSVKPNKSCFTPNEDITLTFVNRNRARSSDWVGIFSIPQPDSSRFVAEAAWVRLCGSQSCATSKLRGSVKIRDDIPVGNYKAILSRDEEEPYAAYAISASFSVKNDCGNGGGPAPGPSPTPPAPVPVQANSNSKAASHLKQARGEIEDMVRNDPALGATFLRMLFHDCVGGCDGTCATAVLLLDERARCSCCDGWMERCALGALSEYMCMPLGSGRVRDTDNSNMVVAATPTLMSW
jgi:hypothetical protein